MFWRFPDIFCPSSEIQPISPTNNCTAFQPEKLWETRPALGTELLTWPNHRQLCGYFMSAPGNHYWSQSTAAQCTLTPAKRFKYPKSRVLKITWKQVQQKRHEARTGRQPTRHRNQKHEKSSFLHFQHARQINLLTRLAWWRVSSLHKHNRTILLWVLSLVFQDRKALYSTNIRLKEVCSATARISGLSKEFFLFLHPGRILEVYTLVFSAKD